MSARDRVLARVRRALAGRPEAALPSVLTPEERDPEEAFALFRSRLEAAGARVARLGSLEEARAFLAEAESGFETAWAGAGVPESLRPRLPLAEPERAGLGVSLALAGVAETGSVVLTAREGRRGQLLVPRHLVWVFADDLFGSLLAALRRLQGEGASALALHSGPSKSADIGQIMVKGVHGPGELWVGVLGFNLEGGGKLVWDRVEALEGKDLTTKTGKLFRVVKVTDHQVQVRPESTQAVYTIARSNLEAAVRLLREGEELKGPADYKKQVKDEAPAYAWAILHALGYV